MEQAIRDEISRFVRENPANRQEGGREPYFDESLVGFVDAADPLFRQYKTVIGEFHRTPQEWFAEAVGPGGGEPQTVVCWVLPVTASTRRTNRRADRWPSRAWAHTRFHGEAFNALLRRHLVDHLATLGYRTVAPQIEPSWRQLEDARVGIASTWSERHAAYAAGLGTFSLNDALITPRGIAHRLGSVITDLPLAPSARPYEGLRTNCLYHRDGTCGDCVERCPAEALSRETGHDKAKCSQYSYVDAMQAVGESYGVEITGCGLCQTGVPCESRIPPTRTRQERAPAE
ncbi:MAG: epoxyqueuosine reductase [Actinobacteria bacterium]|nr:epoxyqueuosine reductase [Actinomycetota bacterium]